MRKKARLKQLTLGIAAALLAGSWQAPAWAAEEGPITDTDKTLTENTTVKADGSGNNVAALSMINRKKTVDLAGYNLDLRVEGLTNASTKAAGIYLGEKGGLTLFGNQAASDSKGLLNISVVGSIDEAGKSGAAVSGIHINPDNRKPKAEINADVTITQLKGGKDPVRGIWAAKNAILDIKGKFKIEQGAVSHRGLEQGWVNKKDAHTFAMHLEGNNNKIHIDTVDIDDPNIQRGIQVGKEGWDFLPYSGNVVRIGGGKFKIKEDADRGHWLMYLMGSPKVYINAGGDETDEDAPIVPGNKKTELEGAVHIEKNATLHLGLNGEASSWKGGTEKDAKGTVNLFLLNGATWDTSNGGRGSKITKLSSYTGTEGHIRQNDTGELHIEKYAGKQKLFYTHMGDGTSSGDYTAGNTHIKTAESDSKVTMVTENTGGIDMQNDEQVEKVLSALAGKLYYDDAKNGETHLKGTAMIAESLTSSAAKRDMVFSRVDGGQGNIKSDGPITFDRQIADNDSQTRDLVEQTWGNTEYSDGKSHYTFKQDVTLRTEAATGNAFESIVGGVMAGSEGLYKDGWINMTGRQLKIHTKANSSSNKAAGISVVGNSMEIKNAGGVDIAIEGDQKSQSGIYLFSKGDAGAKLTIENDNRPSHAVKIRNDATGEKEAAILVDGAQKKAQLKIDGLVDITQRGDVLQVKNGGSEAFIGGGSFVAKGDGNAVRMTGESKVYINAKANGDDLQATSDATDPRDVKMRGNVVLGGGKGDFGMALNTKDSHFWGLIGMEDAQGGKTRMILSNEARWTNKKAGKIADGFAGSYLTRLQADGGAIFQKDARPITIDSYKGNMKVFYNHEEDGTKPEHYEGGGLHINKADADSAVTMVTERNGVDMNSALQTRKVLKALAGKIYYDGAKRGETNLKGTAMLAEGLTLSSESLKIEDILFDKTTGQGSIRNYRGRQIAEGPWYGVDDERDHWKEKGVRANNAKYTFQENTTLSVDAATDPELVQGSSVDALSAYSPLMWGGWSEGEINMNGHDLTLSAGTSKKYKRPDNSWTGAESVGLFVGGGTLEMKELGAFSIKAKDHGIHLTQHSNLYIKNAGDEAHAVKIESEDKGIYMKNHDSSARLHIDGMVDIKAPTGIVVDGGELRIGGGKIVSKGQAALYVNSPGNAFINAQMGGDGNIVPMHEDRDVQIEGDIQVKASSAAAHIALTTKDSILKGLFTTDMYTWPLHQWELASGKGTLVLKNGGTWEHTKVGNVMQDKNGTAEVGDSHVSRLDSAGGIIRQKDRRKILIDDFRGDAKIYYDHKNDGTRPADYEAGDVNVAAAAANSRITMVTENNGITMSDENKVRSALNTLAGKLYYDGAKSSLKNLKGKAMIAEGLTTPSAARKADIVFNQDDGQGGIDMTTPQPPTPPQPVDTEEQIAELGAGSAAQVEKWKQKSLRDDAGNYTFAEGAALRAKASTSPFAIGDVAGNVLLQDTEAGIDMKGKKLTLEATADSDTKRAGGIHLAGGSLDIKNAGAVDISIRGNKSTSGAIYAAGSSTNEAQLTIANGDTKDQAVTIRNTASGDKAAAITARKTGANNGRVTIQGLADIEQEGADLLHAAGGEIRIGGGRFIAKGDNAKAVTISKGGKVYINAQNDGDGVKAVSENRDVQMEGNVSLDIFGGTFGAALTTKDSYIKGRIGMDIASGSTRLYLANGARWENVSKGGAIEAFEGSHLTHLNAKNGHIFQYDTKPLTIDRLSGSLNLYYKHVNDGAKTEDYRDSDTPYGDTHIKRAEANSSVTMVTDNSGVNTADENAVRKTLNALASKLYYDGYKENERNLKGTAMIAEGLTGSAASQKLDLDYRESDGRARVKSNATSSEASGTIKRQIAEGAYDDVESVQEFWKKKGVYDGNGNYTFHHDVKLEVKAADRPVISVRDNKFGTVYWNGDVQGSIDMTGHRLDIKAGPGGHGLFPNEGPQAGWERTPNAITVYSGTLTIKNVKGMDIESDPKGSLYGRGIFVMGYPGGAGHNSGHGHAKLVIENDDDPANAVRIRVKDTGEDFGAIEARENMGSAEVDIKGLVDIDSKMWRAVESHGARVSIGGGTIKGSDVASIAAYDNGTVFVNSRLDSEGRVVATSNTRPVKITGDISSESDGHVVLGLNNKDSFFKGMVSTDINGINKQTQQWSYIPGNVSMLLANGATWEHKQVGTGYHHKKETGSKEKGIAMDSRVTRLQADKGILKQNDPHKITIDNYSGNMQLVYEHEGDGTKAENYKAGDVHIKKAEKDSAVTMVTDSNGLSLTDETQVYKTLNALAGKLYYDGYKTGERNLKGAATISEGLTESSKTLKRADMDWSEASGQGSVKNPKPESQPQQPEQQKPAQPQQPEQQKPEQPQQPEQQKPAQPQQPEQQKPEQPQQPEQQKPEQKSTEQKRKEEQHKIEYGDYETKLMSGVKSAMTASTMAWRAEANDLMKRMGDLRLSPEDEGVWARVYRGKSSSDKDKTNFNMNYTTIQVGYDKKVGDDWRVGVAGSYMKGSSSYESGSGKNKEGNFGIYGTWMGKSGEYVDLIAKIGRLTNEYTVYNDFGHYVKGDFHTWGGSLSAEYGKRISLKGGSFIEPQIELIYSHLNGASYTGDTDYVGSGGAMQKMHVRQGAMNSFVSRLGVGFGQETERGTWFLKASLYHEFAGDLSTEYTDGFTPKSTTQRGRDTWVGIQLGGTTKLNDRTSLYGTFEKTFGGDIKTDWRIDAGLRWSF